MNCNYQMQKNCLNLDHLILRDITYQSSYLALSKLWVRKQR
jgi:hypothetical protein